MLIGSACKSGCTQCDLSTSRRRVMPSYLVPNSQILILGEYPDVYDESTGYIFIGRYNKLIRDELKKKGIDPKSVSYANVVACNPGSKGGKKNNLLQRHVDACASFVDVDIRAVKPKIIVAVGKWATNKLLLDDYRVDKEKTLRIEQYRGRLLWSKKYDCWVLPVWSPEYMRKKKIAKRYEEFGWDIQKLKRFADSGFKRINPEGEFMVAQSMGDFKDFIHQLHEKPLWSCDLETTGYDWYKDDIFLYAFSWEPTTAAIIDVRSDYFRQNKQQCMRELALVMDNSSRKVFQNGSFDIKFMMYNNQPVRRYFSDTMLMHHLLDEAKDHDLVAIAHDYTDYLDYDRELSGWIDDYRKRHKLKKKDPVSYDKIPSDLIHPYAGIDVDVTLQAYRSMIKEIQKQDLIFTLFGITMPMQRILTRTEYEGVRLDMKLLNELDRQLKRDIKKYMEEFRNSDVVKNFEIKKEKKIIRELKKKFNSKPTLQKRWGDFDKYYDSLASSTKTFVFNPNSTKDLRELLYGELKLEPFKFTKKDKQYTKNPSADYEVLAKFGEQYDFLAALAEHNKLEHVHTNFIDGIKKRIKNGRLHTSYLLHGTETGRLSSQNPNLNNIPREGTAVGIKSMFLGDDGEWILQVDGSQLEFRTWGGMSQDERMIRDIELGLDIHYSMAGVVKGRELPEFDDITQDMYESLTYDVTKDERQAAKHAVVFGPMYGRGKFAIAQELNIDEQRAEWIQNMMFRRYKNARKWMSMTVADARKRGYTQCLHGRRRRLPNLNSGIKELKRSAERQAINSPIQGTASDITFIAGVRINEEIKKRGFKSRLRSTVYDSLIYTVPDEELADMVKITHDCFVEPQTDTIMEFNVPLAAEVTVGVRWGKQIELDPKGDWDTEYAKLVDFVKDDPIFINEFKRAV